MVGHAIRQLLDSQLLLYFFQRDALGFGHPIGKNFTDEHPNDGALPDSDGTFAGAPLAEALARKLAITETNNKIIINLQRKTS